MYFSSFEPNLAWSAILSLARSASRLYTYLLSDCNRGRMSSCSFAFSFCCLAFWCCCPSTTSRHSSFPEKVQHSMVSEDRNATHFTAASSLLFSHRFSNFSYSSRDQISSWLDLQTSTPFEISSTDTTLFPGALISMEVEIERLLLWLMVVSTIRMFPEESPIKLDWRPSICYLNCHSPQHCGMLSVFKEHTTSPLSISCSWQFYRKITHMASTAYRNR